jgi:radical SAM superfamily enzyme
MLLKNFFNFIKKLGNKLNPPHWVIITTQQPNCIYYFGPFGNYAEANKMQDGYLEDLMEEKAIGISVKIRRCLPKMLTIVEGE